MKQKVVKTIKDYLLMTFATALLVVLVQILQTVGTKLAIKCDKRIQK